MKKRRSDSYMRILLLITVWILPLIANTSYSQSATTDFDNYTPILSVEPLPEEFSSSWKQKVDNINEQTKRNEGSKTKKENEEFVVTATYSLDKIFSSGRVLFNTSLDAYLNKVMKHILSSNNIREEIKIYAVRNESVNAFAVTQNVIFVNIGLIAKAETEAELAFVLCHEFIHYRNKHVFNAYRKNKEISADYKKYKYVDEDEMLLREASYSRDLEIEADLLGYELFLNTEYSREAPAKILGKLKYAHLPLDQLPFDIGYFNTEYMDIPTDYMLQEITPIGSQAEKDREDEEDGEDDLSTHPDVDERILKLNAKMYNDTRNGDKQFIVSESEFINLRDMCRFELIRMEVVNGRYEMAFYNTYLLEKKYSNSRFIKKMMLKSLYGLASYDDYRVRRDNKPRESRVEGELQRVVYFFDKLSREELAYLTLHYAWKTHKMYPDDAEITSVTNDMFRQCYEFHNLSMSYFATEPPAGQDLEITTNDHNADKNNGKNNQNSFVRYAFVDYLQDEEFVAAIKKYSHSGSRDHEEGTNEDNNSNNRNKKEITDTESKITSSTDIKKMILLDPTSIKLDVRKNKRNRYLATEKSISKLKKNLKTASDKAGIELDFLTRNNEDIHDVQKINDIAFVSDYISEKIDQDKAVMYPTDQLKMQEICKRYGVNHIGIAGEIKYLTKNSSWVNYVLLVTPLLPYAIYKLASPKIHTAYFIAVYNFDTNTIEFRDATIVSSSGHQDAALGNWYYLFKQIADNGKK